LLEVSVPSMANKAKQAENYLSIMLLYILVYIVKIYGTETVYKIVLK